MTRHAPPLAGDALERAIFHWPAVVARTPKGWARDFALSIQRNARKPWWKPTDRQGQIMRRMVAELFDGTAEGEPELIEEEREERSPACRRGAGAARTVQTVARGMSRTTTGRAQSPARA